MKKILVNKIALYVLILISVNVKAQLKSNPHKSLLTDKLNFTLPKSDYFEPAIKDFSLLNKIKTQLQLYPKIPSGKSGSAPLFSKKLIFDGDLKKLKVLLDNKAAKVIPNESTYFYTSPVDNMLCLVPGNEIKFHINTVDPTITLNYSADNMPNALSKADRGK